MNNNEISPELIDSIFFGNTKKEKMIDFVIFPRMIKTDLLENRISYTEFSVLMWIFLNTNPYNGYATISYKGLAVELSRILKEDNARKVLTSLRDKQYLYFVNHRGRGGSFTVYPYNFLLTSKRIQTREYLIEKNIITDNSQPCVDVVEVSPHNFEPPNHNQDYDNFSQTPSV